jgi:hypothetical protein
LGHACCTVDVVIAIAVIAIAEAMRYGLREYPGHYGYLDYDNDNDNDNDCVRG